jgi:hypothetical protein
MRDSTRPAALHSALRFVITSDITAQHKAVLIEVLTQALRDEEAAALRLQATELAGGEWQAHELVQLQSFLRGKVAKSWQHADECVMQLAAQLHRDPHAVRAKANELGLAAGVDYRYVRELRRTQDE